MINGLVIVFILEAWAMNRILSLSTIIFVTALVFTACSGSTSEEVMEVKVDGGSYFDISPAKLNSMLEMKDFLFVNVHIPYEGEIRQTDLFIPFDKVAENIAQFPEDRDAKIVLYCRSDRMSNIAARTMVGLGYRNIWNLDGGMIEWEKQGYEIIHKSQ